MAFFSQYAGGTDTYRLKLKNGPYLDEVVPPTSNHHIRDFTAQNDHLMISMTNGKVYVAERLNELLECRALDAGALFNASYDHAIGGDPFSTDANRITSAISAYNANGTDVIRNASYGQFHRTSYFPTSPAVTVGTSNPSSSGMSSTIRRFMYSGDDLMYINWNTSVDTLYIYGVDNANGTWGLQTWTYAGSQGLGASGNFNFSGVSACTYPEIIPATGDIMMFMVINSQSYKLIYDQSANSWVFEDAIGLTNMNTTRPNALSYGGSIMMIATAYSSNATYFVSTDTGANWSEIDAQAFGNYYFKECGVVNGKFYTISTTGAVNSNYPGMLMSTTSPQTVSSWAWENIPEVPVATYLRNNAQGNACYVSTGYYNATNLNHSLHSIKKLT
jgi:hypothetical protein